MHMDLFHDVPGIIGLEERMILMTLHDNKIHQNIVITVISNLNQ